MHKFLGDAFTLDGKEGGLNVEKLHEVIKKEKLIMNILLMGAIGVGKSSLINGFFGQEVAKAGVGKSLTQHLEKYVDGEKGLILWDTKGIESKDYQNTMESLKKEIGALRVLSKPMRESIPLHTHLEGWKSTLKV